MNIRFKIISWSIYAGLIFLGIGLFQTQVLKNDYYRELGDKNRIRLLPLEAPRGRVFDRQKNLIAGNRASFDIIATPEDVTPEVYPQLAKLLDMTELDIRKRMSSSREFRFTPAVIASDVPRELAFKIEELRPELPGVGIRVTGVRYYPYHETASHLIGYIGKINPQEYRDWDRSRYGMTSLVGRLGIEKIFDQSLRGWRGGRQIEVDARGKLIRVLSEKPAEPGEDMHLTLDIEFQQKIMELIEGKHASVAVLDLETEGLLALASSPAFDPNIFVSPMHSSDRLEVLQSPEFPMLDRGMSSAYPPGSVFKLVTALAALETGKITPHTRFNCPGHFRLTPNSRPFHCWYAPGHGSLDLYQALERSCNVYFYNLGKRLSADDIAKYARMLGLGERLKMEMDRLAPGLVPDSAWKKEKYGEKWYQGETLSFAIGQSYLLTSPLQILKLSAIIAKNGEMVEPHLIAREEERGSDKKIAIKSENLNAIKRAMLNVVESNYGTGQLARIDFDKMAAKTGTAQNPPHLSHAWMTGFFPYKNPRIAFVVFIEHGGSGGIGAARIVKDMIQAWSQTYGPAVG